MPKYVSGDTVRLRPRLHYTAFTRTQHRNVLLWPTAYTEPSSYPTSDEDHCMEIIIASTLCHLHTATFPYRFRMKTG